MQSTGCLSRLLCLKPAREVDLATISVWDFDSVELFLAVARREEVEPLAVTESVMSVEGHV